jgi:hypothetical protein
VSWVANLMIQADQEDSYFRISMYRDSPWNQYTPPPVPDDEDDW